MASFASVPATGRWVFSLALWIKSVCFHCKDTWLRVILVKHNILRLLRTEWVVLNSKLAVPHLSFGWRATRLTSRQYQCILKKTKSEPSGQTLHCYMCVMAHEVSDAWQFPQQGISLWFLLSSELNCMPCCWSFTRIEREWEKRRIFIQAQINRTNKGVSNQPHYEFFKSEDFTGKGFNSAVICTRGGKVVPFSQSPSTWKLSQQDLGQNCFQS